jgi:hypothetical protein
MRALKSLHPEEDVPFTFHCPKLVIRLFLTSREIKVRKWKVLNDVCLCTHPTNTLPATTIKSLSQPLRMYSRELYVAFL